MFALIFTIVFIVCFTASILGYWAMQAVERVESERLQNRQRKNRTS